MPDTCVALSAEDSRALRGVCELPLVSTEELDDFLGVVFSAVSRRLARLEELGLVHSTMMGAAFTAARRYHLTPSGARRFLGGVVKRVCSRSSLPGAGRWPNTTPFSWHSGSPPRATA